MQLITHALTKSISQAPEETKQYSDGFTFIPVLMYSKTHLSGHHGRSTKILGIQSSSLPLFTWNFAISQVPKKFMLSLISIRFYTITMIFICHTQSASIT